MAEALLPGCLAGGGTRARASHEAPPAPLRGPGGPGREAVGSCSAGAIEPAATDPGGAELPVAGRVCEAYRRFSSPELVRRERPPPVSASYRDPRQDLQRRGGVERSRPADPGAQPHRSTPPGTVPDAHRARRGLDAPQRDVPRRQPSAALGQRASGSRGQVDSEPYAMAGVCGGRLPEHLRCRLHWRRAAVSTTRRRGVPACGTARGLPVPPRLPARGDTGRPGPAVLAVALDHHGFASCRALVLTAIWSSSFLIAIGEDNWTYSLSGCRGTSKARA